MVLFTRSLLILLIACCSFGCNDSKTAKQSESAAMSLMNLSQIPQAEILKLYQETDFIDYIFYDLKFSMSYEKKGMIQQSIKWVSPDVPMKNEDCHPMCRMVFQSEGNIIMESELYVSPQCSYIIWLSDGKPAYVNALTPEGYKHYFNLTSKF